MITLADTDVIVLAGGKGTRIRAAIGDDLPKLLAPIQGRPYLEYLFDWLQDAGAARVILSLGHLADVIADYVTAHPRAGLKVDTVIEAAPMGTAGALRLVQPHVVADVALVLNGDSWIDTDLGAFVGAHTAAGAGASVLCVTVSDVGRYGQVALDDDGRIAAFLEKQSNAGPGLVNAGVYAISQSGWDMIMGTPGKSLETDVFAQQPPGTLCAVDAGRVAFIDIGTPESLAQAADVIGKNKKMGEQA